MSDSQDSLNVGWKPIGAISGSQESIEMQPPKPSRLSFLHGHSQAHQVPQQMGYQAQSAFSPPPSDTERGVPLTPRAVGPHTFACLHPPDIPKQASPEFRDKEEFAHTFYTPITCSPEDFSIPENQYTLRPIVQRRRTELLIAITMYNESDEFLIRTLSAVFKNIRYFTELSKRPYDSHNSQFGNRPVHAMPEDGSVRGDGIWNENAWQKIVVVIISDGRLKCHERVLLMMEQLGVYRPDLIMTQRRDPTDANQLKDVTCHLFETTTQVTVDKDLVPKGYKNGNVPIQLMFALKEKNQKKLNSHKWLFRAFAPLLNPYVCVLVDVGTRPKTADSIYYLWKAFDRDLAIAGACGEICVMMDKGCHRAKQLAHPLVAAQNFEYKMSNILDKCLESCFGYISVLPGAFSAYRWEALQDVNPDEGPLVSYFKGEHQNTQKPKGNVFEANMYLAEDRILCLELVGKRDSKWVLHYVKDAKAETDVPSAAHEFISQRRRWLNGTFFCQVYAVAHMTRFWSTNHSIMRKIALSLELIYIGITLFFSWFGIGMFYLVFYLMTQQSLANASQSAVIFEVLRLMYTTVLAATFICSLGNRPQGAKIIYVGSMVIFAIIMIYLLVISIMLVVQAWPRLGSGMSWIVNGGTYRDVVLSVASTYGVYFVASLLHHDFGHVMSCMLQYMLMLPSYINTLTIYAFCNSHDVSWGTKGDNKGSTGSASGKKKDENASGSSSALEKSYLIAPPAIDSMALVRQHRAHAQQLAIRPPETEERRDADTVRDDFYKNFRTWLVLWWVLTNGLLVAIVSSETITKLLIPGSNSTANNPFMAFVMYYVAIMSMIRFGGCVVYLIKRSRNGY